MSGSNNSGSDDYYSSMDRWLDETYEDEPWNPVIPRPSGSHQSDKPKGKGSSKGKGAKGKSKEKH